MFGTLIVQRKQTHMKRMPKRYLVASFAFLLAGLAFGVAYREITKALGYTQTYTPLELVHPHLLVLGMIMMIVLGLLRGQSDIAPKGERWAFWLYVSSVSASGICLFVRGLFDVLVKTGNATLSSASSSAISGISGLCHVVLAAGIIAYFVLFLKSYKSSKAEA